MAWKERTVLQQRKLFIDDYLSKQFSISTLCKIYAISRPTAYLWIRRFEEFGELGLVDRSSMPHKNPQMTSKDIVEEILTVKYMWGSWGPKKIKAHLNQHKPELILPSVTTIGNILQRNGLVRERMLRKRFANRTEPLAHVQGANDVWSADFKGWFMTNDNHKCEPFTLTDNATRYLIRCLPLEFNTTEHVWATLDVAFREYGLPLYLRTDNGPPFASSSFGRLSPLAVKLIKAGVMPDFIDPGKPQQNGRHERMHGTLKQEAIFPELGLEAQKMKLNEFQYYYNFERPHEGIGLIAPGCIYKPSERTWTGRFRSPEYSEDYIKAKVRASGQIKFKGKDVFISKTLINEYVGLRESEGKFKLYFGPIYLADLTGNGDLSDSRLPGRSRKKKHQSDFY